MRPGKPDRRPTTVMILTCAITATVLGVLTIVQPQLIGVERGIGIAQLTAFRQIAMFVLLSAALLLVLAALTLRKSALVWGIAVVLVLGGLWNSATLIERTRPHPIGQSGAGLPTITVLSWNVLAGGAGANDIVALVREFHPDIVILPEAGEGLAEAVRDELNLFEVQYQTQTTYGSEFSPMPTSIITAKHLGSYALDTSKGSTPGPASGVWRSSRPESPTIVGVHTMPPLTWSMNEWRQGLDWAAEQCTANSVLAGDFNATIDHRLPAACADAAQVTGKSLLGTWPTNIPMAFGAPIDHILTGKDWKTVRFDVIETEAPHVSDHRPIVATIERTR